MADLHGRIMARRPPVIPSGATSRDLGRWYLTRDPSIPLVPRFSRDDRGHLTILHLTHDRLLASSRCPSSARPEHVVAIVREARRERGHPGRSGEGASAEAAGTAALQATGALR